MSKTYRDDRRNSFVGNGKLDALMTARLTDADLGMIYINSDLGQLPGEDARKRVHRQTVASTTAGAVTLKRYCVDETGAALGTSVTINIGGTEYTTGSGGVVTHSFAISTYAAVQAMILGINALPGFVATIGDAVTTSALATGKHVAVTETNIPPVGFAPVNAVVNDASASEWVVLRLGLPTKKDRDPIQLIGIYGKIAVVSGNSVKLSRDDQDEYVSDGSHLEEYGSWVMADDATLQELVNNNVLEAVDLRGPLVLRVAATAIDGADFVVKYRQGLV